MPLTEFWTKTIASVKSVVEDETDLICNLSNISAVLFEELNLVKDNKVNWIGFYLQKQPNHLILGPFQGSSHPGIILNLNAKISLTQHSMIGKVACTRIPFGRGVCGTAASTKQTQARIFLASMTFFIPSMSLTIKI
jgi:L-methionine (R)-S-oxide reductase